MVKIHDRAARYGAVALRWMCTESPAAASTEIEFKSDVLYRRISRCGPTGVSAKDILSEWENEGKSITKPQILRYVRQLRAYKKFNHAIKLLEWLEEKGVKLGYSDIAVRIDLLTKSKNIKSAEEYFSSLPNSSKNRYTYGALLSCYCQMNKLPQAKSLFEKMKELNYASNPLAYNNVMSLYKRIGLYEDVLLLAQEMKDRGIAMDTYSYNLLINAHASLKDIDGVEKVFEEMKANSKVFRNWETHSNLAGIYVSAGLYDKAEMALEELKKKMDPYDRSAYHFLISLYATTKNLPEVHRAWYSLKSAFPKVTNACYMIMLDALLRLEDFEKIEECFEEWESNYEHYDMRLANVLIDSYLKRNMIKEAELLCERTVNKGSSPNLRTLVLFMSFFLKNNDIDTALKYWKTIISKAKNKWQPNEEIVNKFMLHFEKQKDLLGAERFFKNLKKINNVNLNVYNWLLRTYIASGETNPLMQKRIENDGIEINSETTELLRIVCGN